MKIWYQSGTSLGRDPRWNEYEETLKSHLNGVARRGTEVVVHGVEVCSPTIDLYSYEELLHDRQFVENLLQAQKEGYDAFAAGCALDPAFYALREIADIPVCSLAEATMHLACLLSPNFSLLAYSKPLLRRVIELVKRYGLEERFIESDSFQLSITELQKGFEDPEVVLRPARKIAREALKKGVCMFVNTCGCLNMIMAKHGVHEIEGIPVIEGGGALIKMTEMLVDLKKMGIDRSKLGLFTPMRKEDLAATRSLYHIR